MASTWQPTFYPNNPFIFPTLSIKDYTIFSFTIINSYKHNTILLVLPKLILNYFPIVTSPRNFCLFYYQFLLPFKLS